MKTATCVAASLLPLLWTAIAQAEPAHGEIAALVGWGTPALNASDNSFGPGIGLRGGASFGRFWLGGTATYQLGETKRYYDRDASGQSVAGDYALSVLGVGGEAGAHLRFGHLVFRPYLWAGALVYTQSPLATYTSSTALEAPIVRFAVAPSVHVDYELPRSGIFFGADVRVNLLVPGQAPQVVVRGDHYSALGWTPSEEFTGEISVFAVIGKRF